LKIAYGGERESWGRGKWWVGGRRKNIGVTSQKGHGSCETSAGRERPTGKKRRIRRKTIRGRRKTYLIGEVCNVKTD